MIPHVELITAPAIEPISVSDVKRNAFVETTDDDAFIQHDLIPAARKYCERLTGRAFITQTWAQYYDRPLPACEPYYFRILPVQSVSSVKYYDTNETLQTMSSTLYQVDVLRTRARLWVEADQDWPTISTQKLNAIQITFVAGYGGTCSSTPEIYRRAMTMLCTHWYHNRSDLACESAGDIEASLHRLMAQEGALMEYA